jgi:hypothetical protein
LTIDQTTPGRDCFTLLARNKPDADAQPLMTWPDGNGGWCLTYAKLNESKLGLAAEIIPTDPDGRSGVDVISVDHEGGKPSGSTQIE